MLLRCKYRVQFSTHQQERSNTVQIVGGAGAAAVEVITANARSDTNLADQQIIAFPVQGADHAFVALFSCVQCALGKDLLPHCFAECSDKQTGAGILRPVARLVRIGISAGKSAGL